MSPRWSNISSGFSTGGASGLLSRLPLIGKLGRDELRVLVQPHQLVLTRLGGWRKQTIVHEKILRVAPALVAVSQDASTVAPRWQAALQQLDAALREAAWQGCQAQVVLSNHFVRYALIPWNDALGSPVEQEAFMRHCFVQAYGDAARQWDIRAAKARYGHRTLASAVEPALVQALQLSFGQAGMRLQHIHPLLMQAVNETRQQLGSKETRGNLCLALPEHGRLTLLLIENGQWRSVQSHTLHHEPKDLLRELIQRDAILAGLECTDWPVVAYAAEPASPALHWPGRQIRQLSRMVPYSRKLAMAGAR
ncbi:hypothetical protein [Methylovorus glucosotrophus]|uniref:Uncharacterized protein n=1 Tax=Methylovorus glucosotrophus (strain SIP3-4) TaxID=582744 RepID=C6XC17_METGS|nr:hypothetical protein [Methylovorus glucosotrophus]ACT50092.1 conserved hypothetical protein [Methylovorus glucosotrophus SIP3-4]